MESKNIKVGDKVYWFNSDKFIIEQFVVEFIVDRNFCIVSRGANTKKESHLIAYLEKSEMDCLTDKLESIERDIQSTEACLERHHKKKAKIERMIRSVNRKIAKEKGIVP